MKYVGRYPARHRVDAEGVDLRYPVPTAMALSMSCERRLRRMNERPRADLGIPGHFDVDEVGPAMRQRFFQRGPKCFGRGHACRADANGLRKFHEIRIDQ